MGNEPDVFRYAKAGRASWWNIPTLAIPYHIGVFLFPIMGYLQNLLSRIPRWKRQYTVIGLALLVAALTYVLPSLTNTFNIVTGIGAVTVPVASTIMAMDVFVVPRLFGPKPPLYRVALWGELSLGNWPGIAALLAGTAVGAITGGLVPGTAGFGVTYIGSPPLQAWATGAVVYLIAVAVVVRFKNPKQLLGWSQLPEVPDTTESGALRRTTAMATGD